jgi:hypothetical protein
VGSFPLQVFVALFDEENQFLKMNIGPSLIQTLLAGEESPFSVPVYGVEEGDSVGSYVVLLMEMWRIERQAHLRKSPYSMKFRDYRHTTRHG